MTQTLDAASLERYTSVARSAAKTVISRYSSSFSAATALLPRDLRGPICDVYALVRVADEIVDGSAAGAGLSVASQADLLDTFERETEAAIQRGFSSDLVVHAFAVTARRVGIDASLTRPFFASMRRDLDPAPFDAEEVARYIYGSAEVVGLMCLRVFVADESVSAARLARLENGAQHLGAAFQKINFLRDAAADFRQLGRNYFPGVDPAAMTDAQRDEILDDINTDVRIARASIPELPKSARAAVLAATGLFDRLGKVVARTPASELMATRVRVADPVKLWIAARSAISAKLSPANHRSADEPQ